MQDEQKPVMEGEALKACPFCGGEAAATGSIRYHEKHKAWWKDGTRILDAFFVNCVKCGVCNTGMLGFQTPAEAIAAWNRRADGWQDIETAPKPNAYIWLSDGFSMRIGFWAEGAEFEHHGSKGGGWRDMGRLEAGGPGDLMFAPILWQPVPASPHLRQGNQG